MMALLPIPGAVRDSLPAAARDFDLLVARWSIRHRKLRQRLVGSDEWVEFDTPFVMAQLLGGLGNVDRCRLEEPGTFFEGVSLRFFDVAETEPTITTADPLGFAFAGIVATRRRRAGSRRSRPTTARRGRRTGS